MKVILVGHSGSQKIVPASRYLASKYLPGFDFHWLNYIGDTKGWSRFVGTYLAHLQDKYVIFALDDYLISGFNKGVYDDALTQFKDGVVAVKLCASTMQEHVEYPVTTQYTIWDREFLVKLLTETGDPWDFEINGSKLFRQWGAQSVVGNVPAIEYNVHSCLSSRWQGVDWKGVKEEDLKYINDNLT